MNFDLLLAWMAHVGEGPWTAFRRAVEYSAGDGPEAEEGGMTAGRAARILSDLGHADFFVDGGSSWRAFAPVLGGLLGARSAVLTGARTPRLVESLAGVCARLDCDVVIEGQSAAPRRVEVVGGHEALRAVAEASGITFVDDLPRRLASSLQPVRREIEAADSSEPPINWSHSCLDLETLEWREGRTGDATVHRYQSSYGPTRYFVDFAGRHVACDRRTAVYAAALLASVDLVAYDPTRQEFAVPGRASLPAPYARTATLCSGRPGAFVDGRTTYVQVPSEVAAVLAVGSGSSYPGSPTWIGSNR